MTDDEKRISFTATIDLPDGRSLYVSVDIPETHPASGKDLGEHAEIASIGLGAMLRCIKSGDARRDEVPF
jgi:hypothetical protein